MATVNKAGTSSNRTLHLSTVGLALQAFYLNLTIDQAQGNEHFQIKPVGPPVYSPAYYGNFLDGGDIGKVAYDTIHSFIDRGGNLAGFSNQGGYYDDLRGSTNGYDVGRAYGAGQQYGQGGVVGGQYGQHAGHNKGHVASGFSTAYSKNERGDNTAYFDDGSGAGRHIIYGAHDTRFKNDGGDGYKGRFHDTSYLGNAARNRGNYGTGVTYYDNKGQAQNAGLGGYGRGYGYGQDFSRSGRFLGAIQPAFGYGPLIKNSGVYVVPMPSKLYYD